MIIRLVVIIFLFKIIQHTLVAKHLVCEQSSEPTHTHDFNCSNLNVNWSSMDTFHDHVYLSVSLDLSMNSFETSETTYGLIDYGFENFTRLTDTLNLSFNQLSHVSDDAFSYKNHDFVSLHLKHLDLSHNNLTQIPIYALLKLKHLQTLDLSSNPLRQIIFTNELSGLLLISVKRVYMKNCSLQRIDFDFFKQFFQNLIYLDLSNNNLISLSPEFGYLLPQGGINLVHNPLVCDCNLIWFKYHTKNESQACLSNYGTLEMIIQLDLERFQCAITFINSSHSLMFEKNQLQFECEVTSYPRVHIGWNYGDRSLSKLTDEPKYVVKQEILSANESKMGNYVRNYYHTRSTLTINQPTNKDIGKYSCVVKYASLNSNVSTLRIINIEEAGYEFAEEIDEANGTFKLRIMNAPNENNETHQSKRFRLVYLVYIFLASFLSLFLLVIILSMIFILIRQNRKKSDENLSDYGCIYRGENSNYYEAPSSTAETRYRIHEHNDLPDEKKHVIKCPYAYIVIEDDEYSRDLDAISVINSSYGGAHLKLPDDSILTRENESDDQDNVDDYKDPSLNYELRKPRDVYLLPKEISL